MGPGRIHHCMRLIGLAERSHELMIERAWSREAFGRIAMELIDCDLLFLFPGKPIAMHGVSGQTVSTNRVEIAAARLMVMQAAHAIDLYGAKVAKYVIAECFWRGLE